MFLMRCCFRNQFQPCRSNEVCSYKKECKPVGAILTRDTVATDLREFMSF